METSCPFVTLSIPCRSNNRKAWRELERELERTFAVKVPVSHIEHTYYSYYASLSGLCTQAAASQVSAPHLRI